MTFALALTALPDKVPYGPWLVFSTLMGASIVVAMLLMLGTEGAAAIPPAVMVSFVVVAVSVGAAAAYLRQVRAVGVRTVAGHPARSRSSCVEPERLAR
ncbi:hypothetical protein [Ornithinimicrobium cerasi]|uniref:Uncharacterized protein n=1 Tax=Ornithinimicrobium cerasi TaxID=2248773 RepID=A0A285VIC8_9MICO|nr:hypothetical protein [Ornithinimicrobium cerasi]SOC53800.1 hypothetical protein SAMN05421879_102158 [Ornithinimicrobium cerasi]